VTPSEIGVSFAADGGANLRGGLEAGRRAARRAMTGSCGEAAKVKAV
jgi:hypothetical protein